MFKSVESDEWLLPPKAPSSSQVMLQDEPGDKESYIEEGEAEVIPAPLPCRRHIGVGDYLPYGVRLFYETNKNIVRMKDIGEKHRILLLGVIGSFTPYCWNRHLFQVMNKSRYYHERAIDYIVCVSTNDPFVQFAWATHLGCETTVFMLSDMTKRFTQALGMDIVIPWLDNNVRSRRYVIYAEDMMVTKMIVAPHDEDDMKWYCEHLKSQEALGEDDESDADSWL